MFLPTITLAVGQIADLHAAAAQRHDRHAAGGLHPDGEEPRASATAASCGATRCARRASRCSPSPASTSARSSAARSSSSASSGCPGIGQADLRRDRRPAVHRACRASSRSSRSATSLVNFFVDILYTVLDPRIRHARATGVARWIDDRRARRQPRPMRRRRADRHRACRSRGRRRRSSELGLRRVARRSCWLAIVIAVGASSPRSCRSRTRTRSTPTSCRKRAVRRVASSAVDGNGHDMFSRVIWGAARLADRRHRSVVVRPPHRRHSSA